MEQGYVLILEVEVDGVTSRLGWEESSARDNLLCLHVNNLIIHSAVLPWERGEGSLPNRSTHSEKNRPRQ